MDLFASWTEKFLKYMIVVIAMTLLMCLVAIYAFSLLVVFSLLSLGIFLYPYAHNSGVTVSEKIAEEFDISNRSGLRHTLFTVSLCAVCNLLFFGLTGHLVESCIFCK